MHPRELELNRDAEPASRAADARLARALQRLPALEPPADGWARLERRLDRPGGWPIWAPTLAAAACALLVALGLLLRPETPAPRVEGADLGATPPRDATAGAPLTASYWRSRSVELERLLADVPEPRVTRASTALTTTLLEDRIALIDEQLSEAAGGASSTDAGSLYRERVLLLDSLVRVRYAAAMAPAT